MTEFVAIRFKNLLSSGNSWSSFNLDTKDARLIIGKNGTGKSQTVDAISFALYKKPIRDITLPQLVNSINKKDLVVELILRSHGDTYLIRRGLKPAIFDIYKNGELLDRKAKDTNQEFIEKSLIGMSYKTFKQVMVLTKTSYVPFMQLPAADRRSMIEDLLDLHVYGVISSIAKEDIKALKDTQEANRSLVSELQVRVSSLQRIIDVCNESATDKTSFLRERLTSVDEEIADAQQQLNAVKIDIERYQTAIAAFPVDPLKAIEMHSSMSADIRQKQNWIEKLERQINSIATIDCCPTCRQNVTESHVESIRSSFNADIKTEQSQIDKLSKRIDQLTPIIKSYTETKALLASSTSDARNLELEISRKGTLRDDINRKIESAVTETGKTATNEIVELAAVNKRLQETMENIDKIAKQIDVKTECVKLASDTGLKAETISKYIPKINELLNFYLSKLDMFVEFTLDETFKETIKSRYYDVYSYNSFSEGQKARIDLALLLTWRDIAMMRNSVNSNLLFFDETFDGSMDVDGNDDMTNLFDVLTERGNTVYVISHSADYITKFDKVLVTTLENNFTVYTEKAQ